MSSPAEKRRKIAEEENVVKGYVHCVSPLKFSTKNKKYFNYIIQTSRDTFHKGVVFSPEKHDAFHQASSNRTPVKLQNVRVLSLGGDVYDVQVYRASTLEVMVTLNFCCKQPVNQSDSSALTLAEVAALRPRQKVGQIRVKVTSLQVGSNMVNIFSTEMEVKECWVADHTSKIKVFLWNQLVSQVVKGLSYTFTNLSVRNQGSLVLTTTRDTIIQKIGDVTIPDDIERHVVEEQPEEHFTIEGQISGVSLIDRRQCSFCQKRQEAFNPKDKFHRCEGCHMLQKANNYSISISGTLVVTQDQKHTRLTMTMSVLCQYLNANNLKELLSNVLLVEEYLLDGGIFTVTHNINNIISSLQKAPNALPVSTAVKRGEEAEEPEDFETLFDSTEPQ